MSRNQAVRVAAADPPGLRRVGSLQPRAKHLPGATRRAPVSALDDKLNLLLDRVALAAGAFGGRLVLIGILPTLRRSDIGPGALTDLRRYLALDNRLRQVRHGPIRIRIAGMDSLEIVTT